MFLLVIIRSGPCSPECCPGIFYLVCSYLVCKQVLKCCHTTRLYPDCVSFRTETSCLVQWGSSLVFQRVQKDDPHNLTTFELFTLPCDRVELLFPSSSRFLWGHPPSSRSGLPEGLFGRVWSQSEWHEAQQPPHNNGLSRQGSRVAFDWHHGATHQRSTHSRDCKSPELQYKNMPFL